MNWTAANGTTYTDEQIEQWATAQETEPEYTGSHLAPSKPGRPVTIGKNAQPFTIRLDEARRNKITALAKKMHTTPSGLVRDLIDAM